MEFYVALSRVQTPEEIHFIQHDERPDGSNKTDNCNFQRNNGRIADDTMRHGIKFK